MTSSSLRHIEIQRLEKCILGGEKLTSLGKVGPASVHWMINIVVHAFIVAGVLSGPDVVAVEIYAARGLDVHTTAKCTEVRQIRIATRTESIQSLIK